MYECTLVILTELRLVVVLFWSFSVSVKNWETTINNTDKIIIIL